MEPAHRRAALDLLQHAKQAPKEALREGARLLPRLRASGDHASASIALRAMGDAARFVEGIAESIGYLHDAIGEALLADDRGLESDAQLTLAGSLAFAGDTAAALATLDAVEVGADELMAARIEFQRGFVLSRAARPRDAIDAYGKVIPVFRRFHDQRFEAMALKNRGFLQTYAGAYGAAESDMLRARELFEQLGLDTDVAYTDHNLGVVATYRGDIPAALRRFDDSEERLLELTGDVAEVQVSRCEAMLSAGLFTEALALARRIREQMGRMGLAADEAEAALVQAQAALLTGDRIAAGHAATDALRLLADQDRPGWVANAELIDLQAELDAGNANRGLRRRARLVARNLREAGQFIPAATASLVATKFGIACGDLGGAATDLEHVSPYRHRGPVELRVQAWLGAAWLAEARGDTRGADAAARAGIGVLTDFQAALGATDARVGVARHAAELGRLGLHLAAASGRPRRIWSWMERTRAGALRFRPARPPGDGELAALLAELRYVTTELRGTTGEEARHLQHRQRGLQERIRRRSHQLAGTGDAAWQSPRPGDVIEAVGERRLVEMGVVDGSLLAVTLGSGRARLADLGPIDAVEHAFAALRLALGRLVRSPSTANVDLVARTAARLGDLLVAPLPLDDREVVVVPPARLTTVPWSLLPGLAGRPVTVAPGAGLWLAATRRRRRGKGAVLAAGPGLDFASPEVRDLTALYPQAQRFSARRSRVADVLAALDGVATAHLATHGVFRADNPLFSALQLADGDLTVFDLEGLRRAPGLIVLSACDSGLSAARPGNELMGLSGALLAQGTRALVASIGLVPDTVATRRLIRGFHERVAKGARPAPALAAAQAAMADTPRGLAAAAGFVCFGAG